MATVKYGENMGAINKNAPDYICSTTDFNTETTKVDGSTLVVVDETSHKVVGTYIAFNGNWNEL